MENISQSLRASKLELEALRKRLKSSEEAREYFNEEWSRSRAAAEKLPLFERLVRESGARLREKEEDLSGLQDDVGEIK